MAISSLRHWALRLLVLEVWSWGICGTFSNYATGTAPGPDSHETGQGPHGHLFGDWGGERTRLARRGVNFDFQYVSDSLWNLKSVQKERFASWNRFAARSTLILGS